MASVTDICNLALSNLGDTATVISIDPPESSVQAEHCARFYPIARDGLLEMHSWGFATKRVQMALLNSGWPEWDYEYAQPADAVNILAVLPPNAIDDYSQTFGMSTFPSIAPLAVVGSYVPQPFSQEINDNGDAVILTDQVDAVLRYTIKITDTTLFSPTFTIALSWMLSSMLAGPLIKGDAGAAESKRCLGIMEQFLSKAMSSDASQRRINPVQNVPWMVGR